MGYPHKLDYFCIHDQYNIIYNQLLLYERYISFAGGVMARVLHVCGSRFLTCTTRNARAHVKNELRLVEPQVHLKRVHIYVQCVPFYNTFGRRKSIGKNHGPQIF